MENQSQEIYVDVKKPIWFDEKEKVLHFKRLRIPRPGILLAVVTCISFSLCGAIAKNLVADLGAGELVSVRYAITGCVMSLPIAFNPSSIVDLTKKKWLIGCIGGLLGGGTTYIAYVTYSYIPLMDAQTLFNIQGVFVAIIASIFLKEKIGLLDFGAIVVVFGGILLICQPSFIFGTTSHAVSSHQRIVGICFGILCAFCQGTTGVLCRSLKNVKFYVFTFLLSCGGIIVSLAMLPVSGPMPLPNMTQLGQLIAIGVLACISKSALTLAFQMDDATPITMVQSLEIVFAFFLQWIFFGEKANYLEIIGSILVLIGITVVTLKGIIMKKIHAIAKSKENHQKFECSINIKSIGD